MNRTETARTKSIHQCSRCGTLWRRWLDDSWSLVDSKQEPKKCCDNALDFLQKLIPPVTVTLSISETQKLLGARKPIPVKNIAHALDRQGSGKWVPEVPTMEMIKAGCDCVHRWHQGYSATQLDVRDAYRAMLAAAPQQQGTDGPASGSPDEEGK